MAPAIGNPFKFSQLRTHCVVSLRSVTEISEIFSFAFPCARRVIVLDIRPLAWGDAPESGEEVRKMRGIVVRPI